MCLIVFGLITQFALKGVCIAESSCLAKGTWYIQSDACYSAWLGFRETLFQSEFGCVRIRINKKMFKKKKWRELQKELHSSGINL